MKLGESGSRRLLIWLTVIYVVIMFFYNLNSPGVFSAQEGRTAILSYNMLDRNDFLDMYIPGCVKYEKPIAYYWLTAASGALFGLKADVYGDWVEFGLRLPSAISALLATLGIALLANSIYGLRVALLSAVIFATMPLSNTLGRVAHIDIAQCAAYIWALVFLYYGYLRDRKVNGLIYGFYVCIGLSMLLKGPGAPVMAALIIIAFMLRFRDFKFAFRMRTFTGAILFLLIGCSWYIFENIRSNGEFFEEFIMKQNVARFTGGENSEYRGGEWMNPFYYVWSLFFGGLPWTVFGVAALVGVCVKQIRQIQPIAGVGWRQRWSSYVRQFFTAKMSDGSFLVAMWLVTGFVFLSAAALKRRDYLLLVLPALAILTALAIVRFCEQNHKISRHWWALWAIPAVAMPAFLILNESGVVLSLAKLIQGDTTFISRQDGFALQMISEVFHDHLSLCIVVMILLLVMTAWLISDAIKQRTYRALLLFALTVGVVFTVYNAALGPAIDSGRTLKYYALEVQKIVPEGETIGLQRLFIDEFVFYVQRPYIYYPKPDYDLTDDKWVIIQSKRAQKLLDGGRYTLILTTPPVHLFPHSLLRRIDD